jgi:threonine dehydrogenase-like Zn-dependent dehydrogenase
MPDKSLAAVLVDSRQFEIRELSLPDLPEGTALLKIEACGICGSDVHESERIEGGPRILGHENVGIVARLGKGAAEKWKVREGDRVALEEYVPCGQCKWCRSDDFRFCAQTGRGGSLRYGSTPLTTWPSLWGGYSEYLYVHTNAIVHKMPSTIPAPHAAAFLPFANGIEWACGYGEVGLGDSILIQGPGQQGLACVVAAKAAGASCIIVSGLARDARRLDVARKLGADRTIDVEAEDLVTNVMDYTGGDGIDVVVNVTGGGNGSVAEAIAVAGTKCNIVLAAAGHEIIDVGSFGRRKIVLKQANGHSFRSVDLAIQFLAYGHLPMEEISTHTFPMNRAQEAIDAVAGRGAPEAIHVSIVPEIA